LGQLDKTLTLESILPVQRIASKFVKGSYILPGHKIPSTVVIPLNRKFSL
jgi:hypothetical protein